MSPSSVKPVSSPKPEKSLKPENSINLESCNTEFNSKFKCRRKIYSRALKALMLGAIGLTCTLVLALVLYVLSKGLPHVTWELLTTKPSYLENRIGILPDILNTLYLVLASLILLLPLGVGAAIYLTEYAKNRSIIALIEYAAESLAGIPSIIFGLFGMLFFSMTLGLRTTLLAGSLTLVIMNLPVIMRTTQESLKTVPQSYREAALALGAGKWRMIRTVVLPSSLQGIVTASILSVGRIVGESAALLFTAGFAHAVHGFFEGMGSSGASLSVALYVYAKEQGEFEIAFAIAAILLILTLIINALVTVLGRILKKRSTS